MSESIGDNARQQLLSVIERVENVEEQIKGLSDDRRDIYSEAKSNGYDVAALKTLVRIRREDADKRAKRELRESNVETYSAAIGAE